jgi:hypothetical protein
MIRFICPGCNTPHDANETFTGLTARCIRCGATLQIPAENGIATLVDEDSLGTTRGKTGTKEPDSAPIWKQRKAQIGAGVGVVVLAAALYYFTSDDPPPEPPPPAPKPAAPKKEEPPPKEEEPPPSFPEAPAPHRKVMGPYTAARLMAERAADPTGFDRKYAGRLLLVRGVVTAAQTSGCTVGAIDDKGIPCQWLKPAPTPPLAPQVITPKLPIAKTPDAKLPDPKSVPGAPAAKGSQKAADAKQIAGNLPQGKAEPQPPIAPNPPPKLVVGQPVTVRGDYAGLLRLTDAEVVSTSCPGDEQLLNRDFQVTGIALPRVMPKEFSRYAMLTLEPPTTDTPITLQCYFRLGQEESVGLVKPGQRVTIRGRCSGRVKGVVRFDNCTLVAPTDPPDQTFAEVSVERVFEAYEDDLRVNPRTDRSVPPIRFAPERLAEAFEVNPVQAASDFQDKYVEITGRVVDRRPATRTIVFETGTNRQFQVTAAFIPSQFLLLPDDRVITIRGVCTGVGGRAYVQVESAEYVDPDGPDAPRTVADYLPLRATRPLFFHHLTPAKATDNPIQRIRLTYLDPDLIQTTPVLVGTFPGTSLFGSDGHRPRWTVDLTKQNPPTTLTKYRVRDGYIEIQQAAQGTNVAPWWDPVFRIGRKRGDFWSAESGDGRLVRYTINGFTKDETGKDQVEIGRLLTHTKDPNKREETTIVYTLGVGEVRRTIRSLTPTGRMVVVAETQLAGPDAPIEIESPMLKKKGKKPNE